MNTEVLKLFFDKGWLFEGDEIIVALSGGADSVALLHYLMSSSYGFKVSAAHMNHGIRGDEANRDEAFVKELCEKWNIPLLVGREDIPARALEEHRGLEETARKYRYRFLEETACGKMIATAHNADDLCETVLLNLTRGTGLRGLAGIPPRRGNIIRPFLPLSREEIEGYCKRNSLVYVTDSTNLDPSYSRNKVRLQVVPKLKEINPSLLDTLYRNTGILRDEDSFLTELADRLIQKALRDESLDLSTIKAEDIALQRRVIKLFIERKGIRTDTRKVETILRGQGGSLSEEYSAVILGDLLSIKKDKMNPEETQVIEINLSEFPQKVVFQHKVFTIDLVFRGDYENLIRKTEKPVKNSLDYGKIRGALSLRGRFPGDKIRLTGRNVTKTLKKLFSEDGVPLSERNSLAVLCDNGNVIWVEGYGVDDSYAVTGETQKVLIISQEVADVQE